MPVFRLEILTDTIESPLRGLIALDDPGVLKRDKMPGHVGLRHAKRFFNLADTHLPVQQQGKYPQSTLFR
jgi:hypothetical protein